MERLSPEVKSGVWSGGGIGAGPSPERNGFHFIPIVGVDNGLPGL